MKPYARVTKAALDRLFALELDGGAGDLVLLERAVVTGQAARHDDGDGHVWYERVEDAHAA